LGKAGSVLLNYTLAFALKLRKITENLSQGSRARKSWSRYGSWLDKAEPWPEQWEREDRSGGRQSKEENGRRKPGRKKVIQRVNKNKGPICNGRARLTED
jgi:hypothetical protein